MKKYKIKTLALLLLLPFVLTACTMQDLPLVGSFFGGGSGKNNETINLSMWGLWDTKEVYQPIVDTYKEAFPNFSLNYEDMSLLKLDGLVEYKKRVYSRLQEKSWDTDIVMVHNSWVPVLAKAGLLSEAPSDLISSDMYKKSFYPSAEESAVIDGKVYGVPAYYDGLVLVYNKEHLAELEDSTPPSAWEELRRKAMDLTVFSEETSEIIRAGAAIGSADNINHFSDILGLMWAQAKVKIPDEIDSVAAIDALKFYISLMEDDKVWRKDFPEATTAFVNGQVSMIFVPSWQILDIVKAAPDIDLGVAPPPQVFPDDPTTWASFWMYVVPKNSDNKSNAWNFINFIAEPKSQILYHQTASKLRPLAPAYGVVSLADRLETDSYLEPVLETAPYSESAEIAARSGNSKQVEALREAIKNIFVGEDTIEEIMSAAKEKMLN